MVYSSALDACRIGDIETLKRLGDVSQSLVDPRGACCLHYGARGGSIAVIEYLVKSRGFSALHRTNTGATCLHDAAAKGNTAVVKWIVENTELKVGDQDGAGITALHLAARYCHFLTIEWLLDEADADAGVRTGGGALPLHFAVVGGDMNCVKILVDENPRLINMQMNNGASPVYIACQMGYLDILQYLVSKNGATKIKAYDGMSCLHGAAQMGHLDVIKWLIKEEKCNPNDRDFDGATPLHFAASRGHAEAVRWMMSEGGAKVTLDNLGGSPLHNAAELGEIEAVKALLDSGCDVKLTDNDGLTADELADKCEQTEAASLIRGEVTFDQLDCGKLETETGHANHLHSPRLSFPPPPPFPPEDLEIRTITNTASTNTSFTQFSPSPPLPPPPLPVSPPFSSPSTIGSPISPPTPIHEEENEAVANLDSTIRSINYQSVTGERPYINRTVSRISVDSSASNFGVFEQPGAVIQTVTAEIHKTPNSVPPTPQPVNYVGFPGLSSHNTTQESIISFSGSNTSYEKIPFSPQEKSFPNKSNNYLYNRGGRAYHRQFSPSPPFQSPPLSPSQDSALSDLSRSTITSNLPYTPSDSLNNTLDRTSGKEKSSDPRQQKPQHYTTQYRQDFNTGTKSSFAKARALFQQGTTESLHICPDNGEVCTRAERQYFSSKQRQTSPVMESEKGLDSSQVTEEVSTAPVANGTNGSASPPSIPSSQKDPSSKSVINIQGGHVTIISTSSKSDKNGTGKTSPVASRVAPLSAKTQPTPLAGTQQAKTTSLTAPHSPSRAPSSPSNAHQLNNVMQELTLRSKNSAQSDSDDRNSATQPMVNGHGKEISSSTASSSSSSPVTPTITGLRVNGRNEENGDVSGSSRSFSRNLSNSSTGSLPFSPVESKNNLIAEMSNAISGGSNLSLRRAKSRGEGVSMVYQSKKGGAGPGEAKNDHTPLSGRFDPKNFLDQVEKVDSSGRVIPEWRRMVLAKHVAEKEQKEFEEKKVVKEQKVEDYEKRFEGMPAWKRALIERREALAREEEAAGKK